MRYIVLIIILLTSTICIKAQNMEFINKKFIEYEKEICDAAEKYGVPELLLLAIPSARENKSWDVKAVTIDSKHRNYCYVGLYQLRAKTSNKGEIRRLQNAKYNINKAAKKLRHYINQFKIGNCDTDLDILRGLTAYQRGVTGARRFGKISEYAIDIYELWQELEKSYIIYEVIE